MCRQVCRVVGCRSQDNQVRANRLPSTLAPWVKLPIRLAAFPIFVFWQPYLLLCFEGNDRFSHMVMRQDTRLDKVLLIELSKPNLQCLPNRPGITGQTFLFQDPLCDLTEACANLFGQSAVCRYSGHRLVKGWTSFRSRNWQGNTLCISMLMVSFKRQSVYNEGTVKHMFYTGFWMSSIKKPGVG